MKRLYKLFSYSVVLLFATVINANAQRDTIQFSWQVDSIGVKDFGFFSLTWESRPFTVNWGDGITDTVIPEYGMSPIISHNYTFIRNYTVTIAGCDSAFQLFCYERGVTSLDVNRWRNLYSICCYNNHLNLSDLYQASEKHKNSVSIGGGSSYVLGTQRLFPKRIFVGDTVDYSAQKEFGDTATVFTVKKNNGTAFLNSDYLINNGIITFKKTGKYTVTMTNTAIIPLYPPLQDSSIYRPQVIVEINVVLPNADATLTSLTVSQGTLNPVFDSSIVNYTVCVGYDIREIIIKATPTDSNAILSGDIGGGVLTGDTTIFTITVTAEDGVTTRDYTVTVIHCEVGINEKSYDLKVMGYDIYDILGRKQKAESRKEMYDIEISHLPAGIYIIKMQTNKGIITRKIFKE